MNGKQPSWLLRAGSFLLAALMVFGNLYLPNGIFAVKAAEVVLNTLPITEDFKNAEVGTSGIFSIEGPDGSNPEGAICDLNGNKVLAVGSNGGTDDGFAILRIKNGSAWYTKVYLSYWLSVSEYGQFYIPSISSYTNANNLQVYIALQSDGTLTHATSKKVGETVKYTDGTDVTYTPNQWMLVEQVYDNTAKTMTMKINGKEIVATTAARNPITGVSMYMPANMGDMVCYVDNITVTDTEHVPMQNPDITNNPDVPATGVSFVDANGQSIETLTVTAGTSTALNLAFTPADATDTDVTFTSSNEDVAEVTEDGKLVAKKAGEATITAKLSSNETVTDQLSVTVSASLGNLPITEDFDDAEVGTSGIFSIEGPDGSKPEGAIYDMNGNKVLTVGSNGGTDDGFAILRIKNGSAWYTKVYLSYWVAASSYGQFYIPSIASYTSANNLEVYVALQPDGTLTHAKSKKVGDPVKYTDGEAVTYTPNQWMLVEQVYDNVNKTITMKINGKEIVVATDARNPITNISMYMPASMGNMLCYVDNITVSETEHTPMENPDATNNFTVPATGMSFVDADGKSIETLTILPKLPTALNVALQPKNTSERNVIFSSSDKDVADFDENGKLVGKTAGETTITATLEGNDTVTAELLVTVLSEDAAFKMTEDFQTVTEGTTGPFVFTGSEDVYCNVYEKNNGNKLLQVSSDDVNEHGFAHLLLEKDGQPYKNEGTLYLSYWIATDRINGASYIPTLAKLDDKGNVQYSTLVYLRATGSIEYSTNGGGSWIPIKYDDGSAATYAAKNWILIEQVYTCGSDSSALVTFKINGREVNVEPKGREYIDRVVVPITKHMDHQVVYVDNMTVSEIPHTPMSAPDSDFNVPTTGLSIVDSNGQKIEDQWTISAQTPTKIHLLFEPMGASDRVVSYKSSNPEVAYFDDYNKLVGIKEGYTTVTVTLDSNETIVAEVDVFVDVIDTDSVTITEVELDKVADAEDTYTLVVGDHGYASAVFAPENADYKGVIWTSSDPSVATVDSYGEILALKPGTTEIIATSAQPNSTVSDKITVVVTKPEVTERFYVSSVSELKNALAEVASINAGDGMDGNIEIILANGYYYLTETLKLGTQHSGTNGYSVIIKAAEDANPVISGATVINGQWTKVEGKNYYSTQVSKDVNSRQLFVNNVRAVRARSQVGLTNSQFLMNGSTNIGYVSEDTYLASYQYPQDLELVFFVEWTQPRCGVSQIVNNGNGTVNLIMDQPGWSGVGRNSGRGVATKDGTSAKSHGPAWIENALELLDEAGEWYLDTHSSDEYNILYYMPRPFENLKTAKVTMPTLDNSTDVEGCDGALVEISGTFSDDAHNNVAKQVMNIHFEGITFADTTWMRPGTNKGHADVQNNHLRENTGTNDKLTPGAVLVEAANGIWFTGCTFTRLGINGLQMINGVQNSLIIGNHFFDISGNAINIGEPDTDASNANAQGLNLIKNNDILNNLIHDIGVDFGSSAAISVGHAAEMDMNHNELFNLPYSGWHIGYGWEGNFVSNNKNMLLEYNFVHDIMAGEIFDGGAIYTIGNTSGESYNIIRRNYVLNQANETAALYADAGSTYYKFIDNVVDLSESKEWHLGAPKWSFTGPGNEHIHWINNFATTDRRTVSAGTDAAKADIIHENLTVIPKADWSAYDVALEVIEKSGLEAAYTYMRNGQIERIKLMAGDKVYGGEDMFLKIGDEVQLSFSYSAIRKGEEITSGLHLDHYYYESLDPAVAQVDENGLIVAKGSGITTVRLVVVSNNVVEVKEVSLLVADVAADVALKDIEGDIILSKAAAGLQLTAVVTSSLGFERTPDATTFNVADKNIAKVTADGYLTPVSAGTTSLTVNATYGGVSVARIYKVVINAPAGITESDAADMFDAEQEDSWMLSNATNWSLVDGVSVSGKFNSYATFSGRKYDNDLLCFKLKIDKTGISSNWPAIVVRAQNATAESVSKGAAGYVFCLGSNGIEVYRFVNGVRYVIRGDYEDNGSTVRLLSGAEGVISPEVSGFTYTNDVAEHDIKVGAIEDGDNVRILLYVDGNKVLDYMDTVGSGAITESGYFGLIGRNQTFTITKATYTVPAGAKESNASDMFDAAQEDTWMLSNATNWSLVDGVSVSGKFNSYATFSGKKYDNELLSFNLKIDKTGISSNWPAIVVRAQNATAESVSKGAAGYVFCLGSNGVEVYRFVNGVRYVIHGDYEDNGSSVILLSGAEGMISPEVSGFIYKNDVAEYNIKVGAIEDNGNVRVLLYVNNKKVVDYLDTEGSGAISEPGYFGLIGRNQIFTLTKDTTIPDDTGDGEGDGEADAPVDTEGKAAQIGKATYETIQEALNAAKKGETVRLLADAELDSLVLLKGVTLDLNGYDLSADYLVAFDGNAVTDSVVGLGLLKCENVQLAANNPAMPVWDEAAGGYRLFVMKSQQMYNDETENSFQFIARPILSFEANNPFMAQSETNGLTVKVRLNWTSSSDKAVEQFFILGAKLMKTIYSANIAEGKVIQLDVSGAGKFVNELYTTSYIESDTGVIWVAPNSKLYDGK